MGNTCREAVAVHRSACFGRRDNRMCSLASVSDLYTHGSRLQEAAGGRLAGIALPSRLLDLKPSPPRGNDQAKPCATKKREQTRSVRHAYENDALCTRIMLSVHACSAHVMTKFMHLELIPVAKCRN